ncbi:immunity protein Imm33 domain-containing protein [Dysosmobacter welbionis]
MYIKKYWGNFIGGSDDSLNLVAFLEDQKQEEIPLSEIFAKIGLDKQNWDFRQTVEYLEFTHSDGVEMDFHFAIDVVTDLAAILLECSVSGSVNLQDLDEYNTPARRVRITATPEEHDAMNKALADFVHAPLEYDLSEMMGEDEITDMAYQVEMLRKELYEASGRNRNYHVKAEDVKDLLPGWEGADGCIATNRITVEGYKVGYCYREKPDGGWDSGWRFTAGDESEAYMDDPNNAGIYKLNTICNDDPDIIPLLNTSAPCAFERDENGVFQQIKDWKPDEDEEDPDMDILKQCQKWHEESKQHKIIDALEAIPAEERTPEMDSELARAYNNLADPHKPTCKEMLKKALALLKPHEEYFEDDYYWNFRMGYSYFYLDQEGRALRYFEKALEVRPGDDDTKEFIERCKKGISLPQFWECFRERTEDWWETFAEMEAELRQMMDEDKDHTRGAELVAQMQETLNLVFDEISFEMGFNGKKHELILTPEGDKVKLFELVYFQKHAPKEVLEHWNILVGRQPVQNIGLRTNDGWEISGDDVQIWLEEQGENSFAISAYCEKLLPKLQEEEGRAWWMLTTLTDQVLGEISHMRYIDSFDVLEEPKAEPSFLLSQLPDKLREQGLELSTDPEAYLESYLGYKMEPKQDPDADWRLDVMAGSTCCVPLINGYLNADNDFMDDLHADGAVAGFFCYPLDTLREEEGSQKIFDFRDKLEEVLTGGDGSEVLTLTGGATGLYCGYVDFIAWDIQEALNMAKEFFEGTDIPWAIFHTFRREAGSVSLKQQDDGTETENQDDELDETLTGMDYIPYTQQNAEAFFAQLEQWNDEDEYTRCIQALNAIPENWRNYRTAYALARALENYAIIGDHDEGTLKSKGDKALLRAIEVLESVREEGQDKAEWNMRMAYGYQYLYGQEEKAIPYAQRWAELDPQDENALAVIQECQEEIAKRAEAEAEDESDHTGVFTGFVLLSKAEWDKEQFIRDMKEKWDIAVDEYDASEEKDDDALVFEVGDMLAAVSLASYPIPGGEAEGNAENNYMWEDAVKVAKEHCAHLMVAVLGKEEDLLEKGKLFAKVVAACCRQENATGIYTSGVVFEPRFYEGFADIMQEDELPIFNWIWFGLWRDENGMNGYTYGLESFGKEEMEVLGIDAKPSDLRDFLASLVSYVLENDVELHDGETIGFDADDKHTIIRSPGVGLPEEQMTLKISWASSDGDPDDDDDDPDGEAPEGEEADVPEVYTEEEMETVEGHIQQYFGKFENVFHELSSPDIHVDICVVPPSEERDYYTLVTMGMGAHRMNVPEELAEYKLERAELAIALPRNWKLKREDLKNERWYWPIRLLKTLARLPIASDTWLGFGHTMDNEKDFAKGTKLCAAILTGPQDTEDGSEVCILPSGEEVNFYQVIPLYRDELEYKLAHDADALLDKMNGISFVVEPDRQDAITRGTLSNDDFDGEMDDVSYHIESIEEKGLPIDPINAYNLFAIYLRWCIEHDLMGEDFLNEYGEVAKQVKADPASVDLRAFIRDKLNGQIMVPMFNKIGRAFTSYYYGEPDSPNFPRDIENYALEYLGPEKYYSDEFQFKAPLFIPFDEDYYQAMAKVIEERFTNWQGQDFDEDTLEPSELAEALMEYLDCECTYFPSMKDDDPIMSAYSYAKRESVKEGFVPVLIKADDETLWECLIMNSDPDSDGEDDYAFDPDKVADYRKKILSAPVKDSKAVLEALIGQRKEEAEDDDMDWDEEILGEMEGGEPNDRFSSYWDDDTEMTYPLILAEIPVKNPWEIFAYLPFGNWNDCPDTPDLMAAAKYWFEQYGAVPAAMSHDELEFLLPAPVPKEKAMDVAVELYGFCPDLDQNEDGSIGSLADALWQSTVWYFWWD